jgi:hypothetical protein
MHLNLIAMNWMHLNLRKNCKELELTHLEGETEEREARVLVAPQ